MDTHAAPQERADALLSLGTRVGNWAIDAHLGSGGMGHVYRARRDDGLYDQQVALKVTKVLPGSSAEARFDRERQYLALLEHPNIARIVDGGGDDEASGGRLLYLAMELVEGEPMDRWLAAKGAAAREIVVQLATLAQAIAHAHSRLVLHRDIKPSNVLIDNEERLRLIDFGVSRMDGEEERPGASALTLGYASPEQLRGEPATAASDVFQIGVLAHQLLTGELPARQDDGGMIAASAPRFPDADLRAITAKAIAADPADRYSSAATLEEDLQNWLGGLPVAARLEATGGGAGYRIGKLVKRQRLASAAIGVAAIALVGGTVASLISAQRADAARIVAEERLEEAEYFTEEAQRNMDSTAALNGFLNIIATGPDGIGEERLSDAMIEYGESLLAELADNPEGGSASLYGVVRYLGTKGYNAEAVRIAQGTLDNPDIPEVVRLGLMETQGRNLFMLDRNEESAAVLADLLTRMETRPFLVRSPGYAAILKNYVLYSGDNMRLEEATALMIALAEDDEKDAGLRAFYYNEAALLVGKTGDLERHVDLLIEAHRLTQLAEANNMMSGPTRTLNLVYAILYGTQDVVRAREFMPSEQSLFGEVRGNIRHRSLYLWLAGLAQQLDGDVAGAATTFERAAQSVRSELPEGDQQRKIVIMHAAEARAMAGDVAAGRALFDEVAERIDMSVPLDKNSTRAALIDGLIAAYEGDYSRARSLLKAAQRNDETIIGSPEHSFLVSKLEGLLKQASGR